MAVKKLIKDPKSSLTKKEVKARYECAKSQIHPGQISVSESTTSLESGTASLEDLTRAETVRRRQIRWLVLLLVANLLISIPVVVVMIIFRIRADNAYNASLNTGDTYGVPSPISYPVLPLIGALSTKGAFAGTGLANYADSLGNVYVFYQDYTGAINTLTYNGSAWSQRQSMNITDAAKPTGLNAYLIQNGTNTQGNLIYVNQNNTLSNVHWTGPHPLTPVVGSLAAQNFSSSSLVRSAIAATYNFKYGRATSKPNTTLGGERIYAGGSNGQTVNEYSHDIASDTWALTQVFANSNGFGGMTLDTTNSNFVSNGSVQQTLLTTSTAGTVSYSWTRSAINGSNFANDSAWYNASGGATPLQNTGIFVAPVPNSQTGQNGIYSLDSITGGINILPYSNSQGFVSFGQSTSLASSINVVAMTGTDMCGVAVHGVVHLFLQTDGQSISHISIANASTIETLPI